ncbi:hypothetical protein [Haladaptatus sp. CMAA 1911]
MARLRGLRRSDYPLLTLKDGTNPEQYSCSKRGGAIRVEEGDGH